VLPVIIVPRESNQTQHDHGLRVNGADLETALLALRTARADVAAGAPALLTLLTPPFMGHARRGPSPPRSTPGADPLALMKERLTPVIGDAEVAAMETRARDTMAGAARLLSEAVQS
jgi:TPP-dependent pyruvate/acetoin dehydrogenase alpha subunit